MIKRGDGARLTNDDLVRRLARLEALLREARPYVWLTDTAPIENADNRARLFAIEIDVALAEDWGQSEYLEIINKR